MADKKLWGGRFKEGTSASVEAYTESVSFDWRLYREDIAGSQAHARMLARQGVLTSEEAESLCRGLDQVRDEIESGAFQWKAELEDVHMNIEARLTGIVGPVGGKLHTGRSRNDQVGVDFRLHVARRLGEWSELLAGLVAVLANRAAENQETLLPGCTHLQPAQPVSLAQHLLAYACMFRRDHQRVADCLKRVRVSPLGAAALSGTTYPLDPASAAAELGFDAAFENSMDAVSDRDYVVESLCAGSLIMAHLSRFCEELILWANPQFGYIRLPDAYSTGSSIMPQKKNPDICELMRGKTGRVYGALVGILTLIKGLPMTYNRDMQEDKEPFFDADATVRASLAIMADMLAEIVFVPEAMERALEAGFLNATELADYLVGRGMPFRQAHHASGACVALAESLGCGLADLSLEQMCKAGADVENDVYAILSYRAAVERRVSPGGTGPESVRRQLEALRLWISERKEA
ncbi:argininosuccinate lyase [Paucidesulfovibrio longus]|uniref:argininosuccinate lyase n=1 Tax=Paucidesulfovibrio longus TaxID=889 RepID=UPI0003B42990|nr:argininosuccinate lyase [Paucidesulfovibrio longus]